MKMYKVSVYTTVVNYNHLKNGVVTSHNVEFDGKMNFNGITRYFTKAGICGEITSITHKKHTYNVPLDTIKSCEKIETEE